MIRDNFCYLAKPIFMDRELDTKITVEQIIDHNVVWECKCNKTFYEINKELCDGEI